MNGRATRLLVLSLLAAVFTVAFTFVTIEAPAIISRLLPAFFPDYNPAFQAELIEGLISNLGPVAYVCVVALAALAVVGFKIGKAKLSSLGSLAMFLPTFGYYSFGMFFLTGLGILRILWVPFWDVSRSFVILKLGDIAYLPYAVFVYPFWVAGMDVRRVLAHLAVGMGLLVFFLGTVAWFYGKLERRKVIDFWVYRFSRHPQYLGFLVWSYGVMLLATLSTFPRGGYYPGPSLPWLLSSLIIMCVAFKEEVEMTKTYGQEYLRYQQAAPFMVPLPKPISSIVKVTNRRLIRKELPETGKEIFCAFLLYLAILVLLSLPFFVLNWPPGYGWNSWPRW